MKSKAKEAAAQKRIVDNAETVALRLREKARTDPGGADMMASVYLVGAVAFFMETRDRRDLFAMLTGLAEDAIAPEVNKTGVRG